MKIDYEIMKLHPNPVYTYDEILDSVSNSLGIPTNVMKSKTRKQEVVYARFIYMNLSKRNCKGFTLVRCGKVVNRDHATVLHGLKEYDNLKNYKDFRDLINKIELRR